MNPGYSRSELADLPTCVNVRGTLQTTRKVWQMSRARNSVHLMQAAKRDAIPRPRPLNSIAEHTSLRKSIKFAKTTNKLPREAVGGSDRMIQQSPTYDARRHRSAAFATQRTAPVCVSRKKRNEFHSWASKQDLRFRFSFQFASEQMILMCLDNVRPTWRTR